MGKVIQTYSNSNYFISVICPVHQWTKYLPKTNTTYMVRMNMFPIFIIETLSCYKCTVHMRNISDHNVINKVTKMKLICCERILFSCNLYHTKPMDTRFYSQFWSWTIFIFAIISYNIYHIHLLLWKVIEMNTVCNW